VAVTPNGKYVYVTNGGSDTVSVINTPAKSVPFSAVDWSILIIVIIIVIFLITLSWNRRRNKKTQPTQTT